jgi:hypothetical protein
MGNTAAMTAQDEGTGAFSVFITNLGRYNEGELVGEWLFLPTTKEGFADALERIGVDGERYEEYFITDYDIELSGFTGVADVIRRRCFGWSGCLR